MSDLKEAREWLLRICQQTSDLTIGHSRYVLLTEIDFKRVVQITQALDELEKLSEENKRIRDKVMGPMNNDIRILKEENEKMKNACMVAAQLANVIDIENKKEVEKLRKENEDLKGRIIELEGKYSEQITINHKLESENAKLCRNWKDLKEWISNNIYREIQFGQNGNNIVDAKDLLIFLDKLTELENE